jgi:hypothetical protein
MRAARPQGGPFIHWAPEWRSNFIKYLKQLTRTSKAATVSAHKKIRKFRAVAPYLQVLRQKHEFNL